MDTRAFKTLAAPFRALHTAAASVGLKRCPKTLEEAYQSERYAKRQKSVKDGYD